MWLGVASVNLALAVMLGAFGAHKLKAMLVLNQITEKQLGYWHTATEYYFYHALGLLVIGLLLQKSIIHTSIPAYLLQLGIIFFSGSLYAMTLGAPTWFGAITPIGGMLFFAGWLHLAYICFTTLN